MSKQDYTSEVGPSWWDVYKLIDEMEREYIGKVRVSINRAKKHGKDVGTFVRTSYQTWDSEANGVDTCAKGNWWDKSEYKSLPALIYAQLHYCHEWLSSRQTEAERQQGF